MRGRAKFRGKASRIRTGVRWTRCDSVGTQPTEQLAPRQTSITVNLSQGLRAGAMRELTTGKGLGTAAASRVCEIDGPGPGDGLA